MTPYVSLIATVARNGVIGYQNQKLWNLPFSQARAYCLIKRHPTMFGRKTFENLNQADWPQQGVILSRQWSKTIRGLLDRYDSNLPQECTLMALSTALYGLKFLRQMASQRQQNYVWVAGGAELYRNTLAVASTLILTVVDDEPIGDAYFPLRPDQLTAHGWHLISEQEVTDSAASHQYRYLSFGRR